MTLTESDLQELTNYAAAGMSLREAATGLGVDADELKQQALTEGSPAYNAYQAGKLATKLKVQTSIMDLAGRGSSPAQALALKLLDQQEREETI